MKSASCSTNTSGCPGVIAVSGSTQPALGNRNIRNVLVKDGVIKKLRILGFETKASTHVRVLSSTDIWSY